MSEEKLDFGVMCNGVEFSDWEANCLRKLREVEGVNLELLIIDDSGSADVSGPLKIFSNFIEYKKKTSAKDTLNKIAWSSYKRAFDAPPCKSKTDLSDELESVKRINCDVKEDGFSKYLYQNDINEIRSHELDFILLMGFGIMRGDILEVPTYGIWSYHHGDERKYRGGPACFWEIYNDDPVTGAILQRLTDRLDGGIILKRGTFPTKRTYNDNLNTVYYGTTEWPAQVAIDILNGNADYVNQSPTSTDAPILRSPSPLQILSYNLKKWSSLGTSAITGISHWNIGVLQHPIEKSIQETFNPKIEWYPHPKRDGYLADPFPITIDNTLYIFAENYSYSERKGKISYIEYPDGFQDGNLRTAHEEPEHMSYPYLFKHDNTVYATPEIYQSNEIRLYEVHSPSDWELKTTLVENVDGVDPTVIKHKDRWWMFYTKEGYSSTKLYIQFSEDLTGDWTSHQMNPVKTDVRSSRPGGTPFVKDSVLYRPAQCSVGGYGKKIVIHKVEKLNAEQYSEEKVSVIQPSEEGPYTGMHTLSSRGNISLVDRKKRIRNKHAIRRRAKQIGSKLLV